MEFLLIPPGEFLMGSTEEEQARFLEEARANNDMWNIERIPTEGPRHRVRITDQRFASVPVDPGLPRIAAAAPSW